MKYDLSFYDLMGYEVPFNKENFFLFDDKIESFYKDKFNEKKDLDKPEEFSGGYVDGKLSFEKTSKLKEFVDHVNKYAWIYRSMPFISNIYLCNSISFGGIKEGSDIDLFMVVDKNRIWLARFFSMFLFQITGIRRKLNKTEKRFDLGFYVTHDHMNLYGIMIKPYDIYMIYWLSHLVPLYAKDESTVNDIWESNKWVNNFLPNFTNKQSINIGTNFYKGSNGFKKIIEKLFGGVVGNVFEQIIKSIRCPIMIFKKKRLGQKAWGIIISDKVLKFHGDDVRRRINLKYKMLRNGNNS